MFEIKDLYKKYKNEYALRNLNFEIGKGLNFIVGASGSGKSTLLKIISGMDSEFEGEVLYKNKSIKNLTDNEKAYYYNNKFGFIWQDFNLIEDMTVEENISLPTYIKKVSYKNEIEKLLRKLRIYDIRKKKVKFLSGGQKQRVAIARELIKNPEVIIADEPTSALDRETSIEVIEILKEISKERTVIIVTHDTSLLDENSKVYELDKGEIISKPSGINLKHTKGKPIEIHNNNAEIKKLLNVAKINNKSKISRSIVTCLSIIVSTVLLMISLGGIISKNGDESFDKLFKQYGNTILDINVVKSFISAHSEKNDSPKADVDQNINGLYEKYINDERVEFLLFIKAFNNIKISTDGKEYAINGSNTVPTINKMILGNIPKNKGEVVVPESFVKNMGISNEEAIGKEIDFKGSIYNWDSGEPEDRYINIKAKIVGIADTSITSQYNGVSYEDKIEDAFFFDKETLDKVNEESGIKEKSHNFTIRADNPKALIEIKNEISKKGIVPLGQFELVEDIVNLDSQSSNLSKTSTIIISLLSLIGVGAIALVTAFMRKCEYGIYKVCGYSKSQLSKVLLGENIILAVISVVFLLLLSPGISILTKIVFGIGISNIKILAIGSLISLCLGYVFYIISSQIAKKVNPIMVFKSGER